MMIETCKTFKTEREAAAFMLGYESAMNLSLECGFYIDPEEKQTVLMDLADSQDEATFIDTSRRLNLTNP